MADAASAEVGGAGQIGRYFTVVSLVPAVAFVTYLKWLLGTGALSGDVDPAAGVDVNLPEAAATGAVALVVALALNPLQFGILQLFEGYWGRSRVAVSLQAVRTAHHRRRADMLDQERLRADSDAYAGGRSQALEGIHASLDHIAAAVLESEGRRLRNYYPDRLTDVHATRLGNVLRRYERNVGRPYGLDLILATPRLAMIAGERELDYLQNQRTQLELAVRTSMLALLASLITVAVMSSHGGWLLVALGPYAVAWLAYRGAVVLAHEYGRAMSVMLELNRFAWYERMGLARPLDTKAERSQNQELMAALSDDPTALLHYPPASGNA